MQLVQMRAGTQYLCTAYLYTVLQQLVSSYPGASLILLRLQLTASCHGDHLHERNLHHSCWDYGGETTHTTAGADVLIYE